MGHRFHLSPGLIGFLVAVAADGPEVTSALVALSRGSQDVGLGVVVGSNIYNIAGLLGLSAVLAGTVSTGRYRITVEGTINVALTAALGGLVLLPAAHTVLGAVALAILLLYVAAVTFAPEPAFHLFRRPVPLDQEGGIEPTPPGTGRSVPQSAALLVVALVGIVAGSDLLVRMSLSLAPTLGIPGTIVGTFVLAVATSLPNTWAAVALARRGHASAAIAATFNSNSINIAIGVGLPALLVPLRAAGTTRTLDVPWLLLMTLAALTLVASRPLLRRVEGGLLLALYAGFVALRLAVF